METTAGTVAALIETEAEPIVTACDDGTFLLELGGEGALGFPLSADQLRALVSQSLAAQLFDPEAADAK
jgi:hypothetical protein